MNDYGREQELTTATQAPIFARGCGEVSIPRQLIKKACGNCQHYDAGVCRTQPPFQIVGIVDFCDFHFVPSEKAVTAAKEMLEKLVGTVIVSE